MEALNLIIVAVLGAAVGSWAWDKRRGKFYPEDKERKNVTRWKNKETKKFYAMLAHATSVAGRMELIVFSPEDNPHQVLVMGQKEFFDKFENAGLVQPGSEPWNKMGEK